MSAENLQDHILIRERMAGVYNALATDSDRTPAETQRLVEESLIPRAAYSVYPDARTSTPAHVARAILEIGPQACRSVADVEHWMTCFYSKTVQEASQQAKGEIFGVRRIFTSLVAAIENDPDPAVDKPAALEALGKWLTYPVAFDDETTAAHNLPKNINTLANRARNVAHVVLTQAFSDSFTARRDAGLLTYDKLPDQLTGDYENHRGLVYAAMAATHKSEKGYQAPLQYTPDQLVGKLRRFDQRDLGSQNVSGEAMRYVIERTFENGHGDREKIAEYAAFAKNYTAQALEILHDMPGLNTDVRRYVRAALGEFDKGRHSANPNSDKTIKTHSLIAVAKGLVGALNKNVPEGGKLIQIGDTATIPTALHAAELLQTWACQQSAALPNVLPKTEGEKQRMQTMLEITQALTSNIAGNNLDVSLPALTREQARLNYNELLVNRHVPELQALLEKWPTLTRRVKIPPLELIEHVSTLSRAPVSRHEAIAAYINLSSDKARQLDSNVKGVGARVAQNDRFVQVKSPIRYIAGLIQDQRQVAASGVDYTRPEQRLVLLANQWKSKEDSTLDARNPIDQLEAQKQLLAKTIEHAARIDTRYYKRRDIDEYSAAVAAHLQALEEDKQRIAANQQRIKEAQRAHTQAKQTPVQERGTTGERRPPAPGLWR